MINVSGIPGRTALVNEKEYLFFSGFAYLGMPALPEFRHLIGEGLEMYGAVFPSSRISNTRTNLYDAFEAMLSAYTGLEASVSFSSGYLAAQAAARFVAKNSMLLYAPHSHPSLWVEDADKQILPGEKWQDVVLEYVNDSANGPATIVMESVNPLTGEIHDFSWLEKVTQPVQVLIDDSHGIGILGEKGEGAVSMLPSRQPVNYIICYSLSKAFSCEGGAVSGDLKSIEGIKRMPHFTAATPMSPAFVHAWMKAQGMFQLQRQKLAGNIDLFREKVKSIPALFHHHHLPVCKVNASGLYEHCLAHYILLSAFRYPSEQDPLSSRIVLNALHTVEDMDRLIDCVLRFK